MKEGLIYSSGEWILFLDADLKGLSKEHIVSMIDCIQEKMLIWLLAYLLKAR